jgi:hypothetical protein
MGQLLPLKCHQLQTVNSKFVPLEKPATSSTRRDIRRPVAPSTRFDGAAALPAPISRARMAQNRKPSGECGIDRQPAGPVVRPEANQGIAQAFLRRQRFVAGNAESLYNSLLRGALFIICAQGAGAC